MMWNCNCKIMNMWCRKRRLLANNVIYCRCRSYTDTLSFKNSNSIIVLNYKTTPHFFKCNFQFKILFYIWANMVMCFLVLVLQFPSCFGWFKHSSNVMLPWSRRKNSDSKFVYILHQMSCCISRETSISCLHCNPRNRQ